MEGAVQYLTQGPSVGLREWPKNKKKPSAQVMDGSVYLHTMCMCTLVHGGGAHKQPGLLPCLTVAIGYETAPTSSRRPARTKRLLPCSNLWKFVSFGVVVKCFFLAFLFFFLCVGRAMLFE
jgi:hypothetical protein